MQIDDDLYPIVALLSGAVILFSSLFTTSNRELTITIIGAASGLFAVSGTAYQTKVRGNKPPATTRSRNTQKDTPPKDTPPKDTPPKG